MTTEKETTPRRTQAEAAKPEECCSTQEKATCCEPSDKAACCGPTPSKPGACGCR
ncbi:MAG TPA: hypothetical protein VHB97_25470 [Polyangia bacterium]|nr:hypothetical protein [Polyangia bacterium]